MINIKFSYIFVFFLYKDVDVHDLLCKNKHNFTSGMFVLGSD